MSAGAITVAPADKVNAPATPNTHTDPLMAKLPFLLHIGLTVPKSIGKYLILKYSSISHPEPYWVLRPGFHRTIP